MTKKLDPIAEAILEKLASGKDVLFREIAQYYTENNVCPKKYDNNTWRKYLPTVKHQALYLWRQGKIDYIRRGEIVDPKTVKGIVRIRLKK